MARHSHWAQIKLKKGAEDVKRGKVFTRHARLIEMCARQGGGDPDTNPTLRSAIDNARADNVPRDNIDRAIKKGTGESKDAAMYEEVLYEGFGPGGAAILVEVFTDNRNRANQAVRAAFVAYGGTMASSGAAHFMFERKGEIVLKSRDTSSEARDLDELEIIDSGAQDVERTEEDFIVYTAPNNFAEIRKKLQQKGFILNSSRLTYVPTTIVTVADAVDAQKLLDLVDALDNEEEVTNVSANFEILNNLGTC